jgi:hypothetical protein
MNDKIKNIVEFEQQLIHLEAKKAYYNDIRYFMNAYSLDNATLNLVKRENGNIVDYKSISELDLFVGVKTFIRDKMYENIQKCNDEINVLKSKLKEYNL